MTRTLTALIVAGVLALGTSVSADTSDSTRGFSGTNLDNKSIYSGGVTGYPAAPAQSYVPWSDDFIPFASANTGVVTGAGLQGTFIPTVTADKLKAMQDTNTAHRRALYNSLVANGGCNADFLPVEYAKPCSYTSFGKQTEGGGDGSNTGGEE
jgi:hypothetical protein